MRVVYNEFAKVAYTEFAVEVWNMKDDTFIRRLAVFPTYDEAEKYFDECDEDDFSNIEYLQIIYIDYDENDNEISFGAFC